ncbi:MAG: hypothetical protein KF696_12685 [Planctomycetes bacterium]|nr:hypothetical protein [Planctomycetota bacterium]MCW8135944.1 hypothetical protein [Planctomycetota bacterium]
MARLCCLIMLPLLASCTVLGYEPTPEELEAIRRGEDPRANEQPRQGNGGEQPEGRDPQKPREAPVDQPPGPLSGIVLRWVNSAVLVIEAEGKRETVALAGEAPLEDGWDEERRLDERMNKWTYGTQVTLEYPTRNGKGETIYRDGHGRLVAIIR